MVEAAMIPVKVSMGRVNSQPPVERWSAKYEGSRGFDSVFQMIRALLVPLGESLLNTLPPVTLGLFSDGACFCANAADGE